MSKKLLRRTMGALFSLALLAAPIGQAAMAPVASSQAAAAAATDGSAAPKGAVSPQAGWMTPAAASESGDAGPASPFNHSALWLAAGAVLALALARRPRAHRVGTQPTAARLPVDSVAGPAA